MKSLIAISLIFPRLFAFSYALSAAFLGNFSDAPVELRSAGAGFKDDADMSRAHAASLKSRSDGTIAVTMYRSMVGIYVVEIGFGMPVMSSALWVDTGSPITWCKDYIEVSTTKHTGFELKVTYSGDRDLEADAVLDQVTIADNLVIVDQMVGAAFQAPYFDGHQGLLGLGPVGLSRGMISSNPSQIVPTVMNNLKSQGLIAHEVFSIYIPSTAYSGGDDKGKLIFGGDDKNFYEGDIRYVPLTKTHPTSEFWGVDLISIWNGQYSLSRDRMAGFLDSGARLIYFAQDLFNAYKASIPGAIFDSTKSYLIEIPPSSLQAMRPLHFQLWDQFFTMDVNDQLLAPEVNAAFGGDPQKRYTLFVSKGPDTHTGSGDDFTLGIPFMKVFYTVFDAENQRLGFAKAKPVAVTG